MHIRNCFGCIHFKYFVIRDNVLLRSTAKGGPPSLIHLSNGNNNAVNNPLYFKIELNESQIMDSLKWSKSRGNRSGRTAWQYIIETASNKSNMNLGFDANSLFNEYKKKVVEYGKKNKFPNINE